MAEFDLAVEFPQLAREITERLVAREEAALASSVSALRVIDRCRCGDEFCASMYMVPRPEGAWGSTHRNVDLRADEGDLILDVVDERIVYLEVLFRDAVRDRLQALLP